MLVLARSPRIKPAGNISLRIKRNSRLANGLVAAIVSGGQFGLGREMVSGIPMVVRNGSPIIGGNNDGLAASYPSSSDGISTDYYVDTYQPTTDITVAWRGQVASIGAGGSNLASTIPNGGGGANNTPFALSLESTGKYYFVRSNSGFRAWMQGTAGAVADQIITGAVSQATSINTTPRFYNDGVYDTSAPVDSFGGSGTGAAGTNTHFLTTGVWPNGSGSSRAFTSSLVLVWNRVLSDNEHVIVHDEPYSFLEETSRYYFMPSAGGPVTYNETISDSVTASDVMASILAANNSISDSVAASDAMASAQTMPNVIADSVVAGESFTTTATMVNTIADSVVAADAMNSSLNGTGEFVPSVIII